MEISGIESDCSQSSMLFSQREFQIFGKFSVKTRICLSLGSSGSKFGYSATGLPEMNLSLEKGEGQINQDILFLPDSEITSTNLLSVPLETLNSA